MSELGDEMDAIESEMRGLGIPMCSVDELRERRRQSLVGRLIDAYLSASLFSLDCWAESARVAASSTQPAQAQMAAAMAANHEAEADRLEAIAKALTEMTP